MDLNEPPTLDDEKGERTETAVEIMRREREERRTKMAARFFEEELKRKQSGGGGGGGGGEASVPRPPEPKTAPRPPERPRNIVLPDGWIDCPSFGQPLVNLIPSKVPLGDHFNEVIEAGKRYSSKQVVKQQRALGREVALVIDLTNTTRYYSTWDWINLGIKHVKIPCKGRDEIPDNESVNNFVFEVIHFFHLHKVPGNKHVLVHCTHGHNRTGFMIIHFLKRTQGISIEKALQLFAEARPPGIYKQEYIESLFCFYNERRRLSVVCPATPEWKRSSSVDLNGEANDVDDDGENDRGIMAALQDAGLESEPMTNDDVLGDAIPQLQQLEMQLLCYWGLGMSQPPGHGTLTFPGSQPVSLDRSNLQLLRQRYYYATWKADGTRYMMFITSEGCYLVDRKFQFRRVQLRFPNKNKIPTELHHLTLLDGEMIIDNVPETGQQTRRYLVYDLIMINNESVIKLPFHERWKRIQRDVIEPRLQEAANIKYYSYDMEAFRVRRKDFWMLSATQKLLRDFIPKLSHEADGLIFQGWDDPYVPRTHDGLLKWKYAHMNSVDFRFEVSSDSCDKRLFLIDKGRLQQLVGACVSFPEDEDPSTLSGKIIECAWHPDTQIWEFMRVRCDKEFPNAWNTYHKVMQSILDNITEEDLLAEIQNTLQLPMYQERISQGQLAPRKPHAQLVKKR